MSRVTEPLEFGILGPFEVTRNGRAVELPAGKPRGLLALLLLHRNEVVAADTLVDELWGERPPATAAKNVQVYVSHLRRALGDGALVTQAPGYVLRVEEGCLDADRFRALVEEARELEPVQASERLREALALWRGPPLPDFTYDHFVQEEIRRLEELRLSALEQRIDADLALGRHEDVLSELESLVRANPLREHLHAQLMVALYRCGRQAEALEAYQAARRRLVDELGLEPSPELQRIERGILAHDPALAAPARVAPAHAEREALAQPARWLSRGRLLVTLGLLVLAAAVAVVAVRLSRESRAPAALPNSAVVIDTNRDAVSAVIQSGGRPGGIAYGAGAAWVTDTSNNLLLRIDPARPTVDRIAVGNGPTGVAVGRGQVWVVNQLDRTVSEVNPRAHRQVATIPVGNGAVAIAYGFGSVWVANTTDDTISRINATTSEPAATVPLVGTPDSIAVGPQGIWVTSFSTGQLLLVNPLSNQVSRAVPIGNGPRGVAVGAGSVWVANGADGTVSRFDPGGDRVAFKITVGSAPAGVAFGDGAVWVANSLDGSVSRIDPKRNEVARLVRLGNEPSALALAGKQLWATVLPSPASHRGGTLRVVRAAAGGCRCDSVDPAVFTGVGQWQMLSLTNDGLVTYRRVGGLAGNTLVPDLATALPIPTDGGRTYTFHLRSGIHYSNGVLVEPEDFRRPIERVFKLGNRYLESFYGGIVGAKRCAERPRHCDFSPGIVADDEANTVTFHLTAADPDFLNKLAFSMADATPSGTPNRDVGRTPLPATGPYMIRSFSPSGSWILERNPRFREWSAEAQPDGYPNRIVLNVHLSPRKAVSAIERGKADVLMSPPPERVGELARRYTTQLHSDPSAATFAFVLNTRVPPFDSLAVRRALNYAFDRKRIVDFTGGRLTAQWTCQILPPTLSGYRPYCPYTIDPDSGGSWTAPDLAKAERLVASSGTRGMKVTAWIDSNFPTRPKLGPYVVQVLHDLGYDASLKTQHNPPYPAWPADSRNRAQLAWFTWFQDVPSSPNFIVPLLSCRAFVHRSALNLNLSEFCNKKIDAQMRRASALETRDPAAAGQLWSRIDRELVDQALWVPVYNPRALTALSARVGNYQYHPFWQVLLDQLWVRRNRR